MIKLLKSINLKALIVCILTVCMVQSQSEQDLVDISNITMFPTGYNHKMYAGYLNITTYAKSLYYVFFQSQSDPANDPLILWLNGGPGCSSLIGMVTEHGPFLFKPGSTQMYINSYSWNKKANIIYLEAPAGVGFSYASSSDMKTNDTQTAKDNLLALRMFLDKFPIYEGNSFYLAGQSYAGIYIPMLAKQVLDFNYANPDKKFNFIGMLLGNPCTHITECNVPTDRYFNQFLYSHGFLEKSIYNQYTAGCLPNQNTPACIKLNKQIKDIFLTSGANIYNVYGTCYYPKYPSEFEALAGQQTMKQFEQKIGRNLKHPLRCSDALGSLTLFNANQFREALHVNEFNDTLPWTPCSDVMNYTIDNGNTYSILPILVKAGLKIVYYSGDQDSIVPLQGTKWWFQQYRKQFGAAIKKSWRPWVNANQNISGMLWQLEGLTLATVRGAGHMVPTDKPAEAQQILNNLLGYSEWRIPDYYQQ